MSDGPSAAGLCADCRHARRVRSARGALFLLCERARSDPRYARYPPLPVLQCPGHEPTPRRADAPDAE